ncbi:MAG: hypothetical protein WAX04_06605 [Oscillospiraceae bacterium]
MLNMQGIALPDFGGVEKIKGSIGELQDLLTSIKSVLPSTWDTSMITGLSDGLSKVTGAVDIAQKGMDLFKSSITAPNVESLGKLKDNIGGLQGILTDVQSVLPSTWDTSMLTTFSEGLDKVTGAVDVVQKGMEILNSELVQNALKWWDSNKAVIAQTVSTQAQTIATQAQEIATKIAGAAQSAFNFILSLNPIALVVIAVVALIAIFALLWTQCDGFRNFFIGLWENLKVIGEWISTVFCGFWTALQEVIVVLWESLVVVGEWIAVVFCAYWIALQEVIVVLWECLVAVGEWIVGVFCAAWGTLMGVISGLWESLKVIGQWVSTIFCKVWTNLQTVIGVLWESLKIVGQWISTVFSQAWDGLREVICGVWKSIEKMWGGVATWFEKTIWQPLMAGLKTFANFFIGIWNGIIAGVESGVNWIISAINVAINFLNDALSGLSWILEKAGIEVELSIPSIPSANLGRLPKFASGGVISRPTLGIMGEYAGASNNKEIITPENLMRKIVQEETGMNSNEATNSLLQELIDAVRSKNTVVNLDGSEIGRSVDKWKSKQGLAVSKGAFAYAY